MIRVRFTPDALETLWTTHLGNQVILTEGLPPNCKLVDVKMDEMFVTFDFDDGKEELKEIPFIFEPGIHMDLVTETHKELNKKFHNIFIEELAVRTNK